MGCPHRIERAATDAPRPASRLGRQHRRRAAAAAARTSCCCAPAPRHGGLPVDSHSSSAGHSAHGLANERNERASNGVHWERGGSCCIGTWGHSHSGATRDPSVLSVRLCVSARCVVRWLLACRADGGRAALVPASMGGATQADSLHGERNKAEHTPTTNIQGNAHNNNSKRAKDMEERAKESQFPRAQTAASSVRLALCLLCPSCRPVVGAL